MAGFDGNGVFSFTYNWEDDANNNIKIRADRMDGQFADATSGFNNTLTRDGQGFATANLPMGGFKHTGVADATAANEYMAFGQIQTLAGVYATTSGSANAYILGVSPAITAYAAGQRFVFNANFANTGAATINVSGLGAKSLQFGGEPLIGGEIQSGQIVEIIYNGTQFDIMSTLNSGSNEYRAAMASTVFN